MYSSQGDLAQFYRIYIWLILFNDVRKGKTEYLAVQSAWLGKRLSRETRVQIQKVFIKRDMVVYMIDL